MKNIIVITLFSFYLIFCSEKKSDNEQSRNYKLLVTVDSSRIVKEANEYLNINPITITDSYCERSLGTKHDFYSEGDYWWPNPSFPDSPYVKKDGLTNPDNFKDHRIAMRNMSIWVASLTVAYEITRNKKYANHAVKHLKAWFINNETKMNPNMKYAQAIKGICPGRGVGLIDGIHLVEPARAVSILHNLKGININDFDAIKKWYAQFLEWMTTHEYGIDERERENNHGSAWVMQAAEYAVFTENQEVIKYCSDRFKNVLIPNQISEDGSFPMELDRTKPYGYSLFNLDILASICQILSTQENNLWKYKLSDGRGMELALKFMFPFIKDKSEWKLKPDVMYWDEWPVRHPSLLFGGTALGNNEYIELWKSLKPLPQTQEGLRNFPIRQPLLWVR